MEEFIRSVISKYNDFKAEAILYEKWLSKVDDPDTRNHLTYVQLKVAVIEAWLNLLNVTNIRSVLSSISLWMAL